MSRVKIFTQAEFEAALPKRKSDGSPLWESSVEFGEVVYKIKFDDPNGCYIKIRSSINPVLGVSDESGEDSIRVNLFDASDKPLVTKAALPARYITRLPGWDKRIWDALRWMRAARKAAGNCPICAQPNKIFKVKNITSPNHKRLYFACGDRYSDHYRGSFGWMPPELQKERIYQ